MYRTSTILVLALLLVAVPASGETPSGTALERVLEKARAVPPSYDQPDLAARQWALERLPPGEDVDVVALYEKAHAEMDRMRRLGLKAELGRWEPLGPGNVGGRTRALVVHPRKPRIRWAAGVSGGIWKTTDGGLHWRPVDDLMANIAVSAMVMDPRNPDVLYAGTGEGHFREVVRETSLPLRGLGIFKSTDAGLTWRRLEATRNGHFAWVNDLVVSHGDPRRVYAATRSGVWRSRDAGRSWQQVLDPDVLGGCFDLAIRTDRPARDILFASCGTFERATVYRKAGAESGGAAGWEAVLSEQGMGRTSLAIAPSNQDVVYALAASYVPGPDSRFEGGLHAVFRSDLAGTAGSWRAVNRNDDPVRLDTLILSNPLVAHLVECGLDNANGNSTLGWYTNTIAVDPTDPDVVFAGGVDLFRSDDGGESWGLVSYWWTDGASAHADQHVLVFHPRYDGESNQTLFVGGDGGVYVTGNARGRKATGTGGPCDAANSAVRWTPLNHGYGVTQFYHGSVFPDGRRYLGGTQDNGTILGADVRGGDGWARILGGDGGYSAIDPRNPNVIYAESQGLALRKSTDGGQVWRLRVDGIADRPGGGDNTGGLLFIVPFVLDPNDPDRLWYGGRRLWRSDDGADSWRQAAAQWPSGGRLSAVAVAPGDAGRVVVGLDNGTIHWSGDALGSTAATAWPSSRPRVGFVSSVAFDPSNPLRVYATYATFGGLHVWGSDDGGATWRALDGVGGGRRLPNLPAHSIVVDPGNPDRLFLGTDLGVFVSTTRGGAWAVESAGFANAVTETLVVGPGPGGRPHLYAFTHGRGAWRTPIAASR